MTHELNEFLCGRYGGFADKRQKRIQLGRTIAVDQHRDGRQINQSVHCLLFLKVFEDAVVELTFAGNDPEDGTVRLLKAPLLRTKVSHTTPDALRALAAAYRRVAVPPHNKSWYYASKEIAEDIERLASELQTFLGLSGRGC